MARLKLSPPWVERYEMLNALFGNDKEIKVIYDEDNNEIKIYCLDNNKAEALKYFIPTTVDFGDVELKITVIPSNKSNLTFDLKATITNSQTAAYFLFGDEMNSHVDKVVSVPTPFGDFVYVIFKKEVIQYYNDSMSDFYGNKSTLCENIAKEVLINTEEIFFCTSNE